VMITMNIQFATGKATIPKKYDKEVQRLAAYMTKNTNTKAVIEGYTDNVGREAANVKLSQNRANAVKNALVKKYKIASSRLEAVGYGPKKPIADNSTAAGRQKNRRVQAVIEQM
ncbi:MAG: OmpA family protein, partial [Syntrophales bacterium]